LTFYFSYFMIFDKENFCQKSAQAKA